MKMQHFLITGGSSGIGLAIADTLVKDGHTVHLTGRNATALEQVISRLGKNARMYPGDVSSLEDLDQLVKALGKHTQKLDGLVLNAAQYGFEPLLTLTPSRLESYFRVNCCSVVWLVQKLLSFLEAGSGKSIVSISSTLATRPISGTAGYAASKAALNSLTQSLAIELAPKRIRCNAVLPGVVDTPIHEPQNESDLNREEKMKQLGPMHLMGRVGQATDVAAIVAFLLSDSASWTTGALYCVDGGISLV